MKLNNDEDLKESELEKLCDISEAIFPNKKVEVIQEV